MLEDRSGSDIQFLAKNLGIFLETARKRRKSAPSAPLFCERPTGFVEVNRDKVAEARCEPQRCIPYDSSLYGGYFINYFNRFGRQWQVYIEAESEDRAKAENVGQFYVRNKTREKMSRFRHLPE